MKVLITTICLLFFIQTHFSQIELKGKWKASCLIEKMDSVNFKMCSICDNGKLIDDETKTIDFELDFITDDVTIKIGDYESIKAFDFNENAHSLEFYYKDILYKFKAFWTHDSKQIVLRNEDQSLILLVRK